MSGRDQQVTLEVRRYDLQGILIPGVFVTCLVGTWLLARYSTSPEEALLWISTNVAPTPNVFLFAVLGIVCTFVIGHVVDGLADFLYQQVYMAKWRGLPFVYLTGEIRKDGPPIVHPMHTYAQACLVAILAALALLPLSRHWRYVWHSDLIGVGIFQLLCLSFVGFALFFFCFSMLCSNLVKNAEDNGKAARRIGPRSVLYRAVSASFGRGYRLLDSACRTLVEDRRKLGEAERALLAERFLETFAHKFKPATPEAYWLIYFHVMTGDSHSRDRINRAINHSIFARNMAFALAIGSGILGLCTEVITIGHDCVDQLVAKRVFEPDECRIIASQRSVPFVWASASLLLLALFWITRFHHWFDYSTKMVIRVFLAGPRSTRQNER